MRRAPGVAAGLFHDHLHSGKLDGGVPAYAMDRYKLLDVNADTTNGTGGDA